MTVDEFIQALENKEIHLSSDQVDQFDSYYRLLVEWNQKVNLTAINDREEVYLKHFYDSLMPLWMTDLSFQDLDLVDIGAGAGFPSVPLMIAEPSLRVTIIDSLNKRINFLEEVKQALGLTQLTALHGRAEDFGQNPDFRQSFDIATARAVAQLNILSEFCLPFVRKGGYFLAMKGQKVDEEVDQAQSAIKVLGGKFLETVKENLPQEEGQRSIVLIRKALETPNKYPRRPGKPAKQPLT